MSDKVSIERFITVPVREASCFATTTRSKKITQRPSCNGCLPTTPFARVGPHLLLLRLLLWTLLFLLNTAAIAHANECHWMDYDYDNDVSAAACASSSHGIGQLRPRDLPPPRIFDNFDTWRNHTVMVSNNNNNTNNGSNGNYEGAVGDNKTTPRSFLVATGTVQQINHVANATKEESSSRREQPQRNQDQDDNHQPTRTKTSITAAASSVSMVQGLIERETVASILQILNTIPQLDEDPDTVDGMPTYEIFVDTPELYKEGEMTTKVLDVNPESVAQRRIIRSALQNILQPLLQERITPLVRQLYPDACHATEGRECTPCYSLIRHYKHGERQSHATHHDGHAIATVVVSLSDFGREYEGGLYVSTGYGQKEYLPLQRGDAAIHRSFLLHGVQVLDLPGDKASATERWSWILWYRDSNTCEDFSHTWFADCAQAGDAVCQQLHATKVGNIPSLTTSQIATQVLDWNEKAATGGAGMAGVKMARAYLKLLPSDLPRDVGMAKYYYRLAMQSNDPDGHYGMANLLLSELAGAAEAASKTTTRNTDTAAEKSRETVLKQVVSHLERASQLGHAFAMFNLGIVHTYGYGVDRIDADLAAEWFVASGLPEGYYVAYFQAAAVGDQERMTLYQNRAKLLGMDHTWRKHARRQTGSGGAAGVDINLPWPLSADGRKPPAF